MDVPLVVFVNTKAGGLQGPKLIDKFKKVVPPDNVYDLSTIGPLPGLQKYSGQRYRIIVCGGDGSVGWVLSEIDKLKLSREATPSVAILPIGTGNDLSRVLKWGGSHNGTKLKSFISKTEKACVVLLDKWNVRYTGDLPLPHSHHNMHNYFSIGADANIALQFHEMRTAHPEKFTSRKQNLAQYVRLGLQNFAPESLSPHVSVEINGKKVKMPEGTRCVVVLNLPSYSGGGNPWGSKKSSLYSHPTVDDGLLEVVAVNGPLQLVGIHANVIRGKRLGQGNQIKITLTKETHAQVDGEPWIQPPSVVNIGFAGKARMLANSPPNPVTPIFEDSSAIAAITLERQPSVAVLNRSMSRALMRTRSSSAPEHTPSPIKYGPVDPNKRKKGRLYCDGCGLEFYLPYMLANHVNGGSCSNRSSSSDSQKMASTPPPVLSVQIGDGCSNTTDATSSHYDSDEERDGIWRTHSSEVSSARGHQPSEESIEVPWSSAVQQGSPTAQSTLLEPDLQSISSHNPQPAYEPALNHTYELDRSASDKAPLLAPEPESANESAHDQQNYPHEQADGHAQEHESAHSEFSSPTENGAE